MLWYMLFLYRLVKDGCSVTQSAFPFSYTGFVSNLGIILNTRSAIEELASVNLE